MSWPSQSSEWHVLVTHSANIALLISHMHLACAGDSAGGLGVGRDINE